MLIRMSGVVVLLLTAGPSFAGQIERACLASERGCGLRSVCGCLQGAANVTLSVKDQKRAAAFFADPMPPDQAAYQSYRQFLLKTSQLPGGFYSHRGRRQLLRGVADMMLDANDPYQSVLSHKEAQTPQLKVVE